jgi:uncharacterized protein YciI
MEFVVIGYDAKDEKALERRLSVREAHLANANKLFDEKKLLFASALLDENENMNGSIMFCDFPSKEALQNDWLKNEPYITGKVWDKVIIKRAKIAKH